MTCIFCNIIEKKIAADIVLEKENVLVIKDIAPKAPIHLLIIPKKHIENIKTINASDTKVLSDLFFVAQELSQNSRDASDFKLVINNGKNAGQHVFHLHLHFLSGKIKENV